MSCMKKLMCRKSFLIVIASSLMIFLSNCNEDEPTAPGKKLALTFLPEGLSATAEIYVTDPDRNMLESELVNGQITFFNPNESAPHYDLTIIDLISTDSYAIKTYQQVPSSSYFIKNNSPAVAGLHRISFPSVASYKNFKIQSEHLKAILPVSDTQFDLQLTQSKSDVFLTLEKDDSGKPSYLFLQQAEVGKTTVVDEVTLNKFTAMTAKLINSAQSLTDSYHYHVYGNISESKQLSVSSYVADISNLPSAVNFYFPTSPSMFTNYTTHINFETMKGNYLATITQIQTALEPSETNEQLEVQLSSYQETAGSHQFTLAGNAEWTHVQLQASEGSKNIQWDVYTPFSTQNTILVPDFLISYLNGKQFTFANQLKFQLIECGNDAATLSYGDFLRLELKKDGTQPQIKNRFITGYYLPQ